MFIPRAFLPQPVLLKLHFSHSWKLAIRRQKPAWGSSPGVEHHGLLPAAPWGHNPPPPPLLRPFSRSRFCTGVAGGNGKPRAVVGGSSRVQVGGGNGSSCPALGSDTAPAHGTMGSSQEKQLGEGR